MRLHRFLENRSTESEDSALETIAQALEMLARFPWACRRSAALRGSRFREMVITLGSSGSVALFEIGDRVVTVRAARHQRESDFH